MVLQWEQVCNLRVYVMVVSAQSNRALDDLQQLERAAVALTHLLQVLWFSLDKVDSRAMLAPEVLAIPRPLR